MLKACVFVSDMEDKPFSQGPDNAGASAAESGPGRADTMPTGIIHRSVSHVWESSSQYAASRFPTRGKTGRSVQHLRGGLCGLSLGAFQKRKYRLAFQ